MESGRRSGRVVPGVGTVRPRMSAAARAAALAAAFVGSLGLACGGAASPTEPSATTSLVGPTWRLTALAGQPVVEGSSVTAEFSSESRVAGRAGCNNYFGSAQADAGRLTVGLLASTLMACAPDAVMQQETRYLATLQAAKAYSFQGDELRLGPTAGEVTLVFTSR